MLLLEINANAKKNGQTGRERRGWCEYVHKIQKVNSDIWALRVSCQTEYGMSGL